VERVVIPPDMRPRKVEGAVAGADVVQFHEPLPPRLLAAVAEALAERPQTELYVYGTAGMPPLDGVEHLTRLSLNLRGLKSLVPLARLTRLEELTIGDTIARLDLAPLAALDSLEELTIPGSPSNPDTLRGLSRLKVLHMRASQPLLDVLGGHESIERLGLSFGSGTDLGTLATLPALRDVEIWQIQRLDSPALRPLAQAERLRSLSLGAARNVERLDFLPPTLRYLMLEKVPSLDTLGPLAELELRALGLFESRPADRSLRPLPDTLRDVTIGDVYPKAEVEAFVERLPEAGISIRGRDHHRPSRVRWRSLMSYVEEDS
jgi:hypothetical protein